MIKRTVSEGSFSAPQAPKNGVRGTWFDSGGRGPGVPWGGGVSRGPWGFSALKFANPGDIRDTGAEGARRRCFSGARAPEAVSWHAFPVAGA